MVQGMDAFRARARAIVPRVKAAMEGELARQAEKLVTQMDYIVPKETRALERSIDYKIIEDGRFGGVRARLFTTSVSYGRYQEFGTKNMEANPFFFPVYRANKKAVRAALTRRMKKEIIGNGLL